MNEKEFQRGRSAYGDGSSPGSRRFSSDADRRSFEAGFLHADRVARAENRAGVPDTSGVEADTSEGCLPIAMALTIGIFIPMGLVFSCKTAKIHDDERRAYAAQQLQKLRNRPTAVLKTDATPAKCPDFSTEKRTCTFGRAGTLAIASGVSGLRFCYYGPKRGPNTYSREYLDEASREWKAWTDFNGVVNQQRFKSIEPSPITITYWLSEDQSCGGQWTPPGPQSPADPTS